MSRRSLSCALTLNNILYSLGVHLNPFTLADGDMKQILYMLLPEIIGKDIFKADGIQLCYQKAASACSNFLYYLCNHVIFYNQ